MARKTVTLTEYTDDLDGKTLSEDEIVSITFGWEGKTRRIDLSATRADQFKKAMTKWVDASSVVPDAEPGRRGRPASSRAGSAGAGRDASQSKAIRQWARANGWPDLGDRGRIPAEVEQAYRTAH